MFVIVLLKKEESVKTTKMDNNSSLIRSIPAKKFELCRLPSTTPNNALEMGGRAQKENNFKIRFIFRNGFIGILSKRF